jgi:hypothetical protein
MWLPKDERQVLRGYYHMFSEIDVQEAYRRSDLCRLLNKRCDPTTIPEYGESSPGTASRTDDFDRLKQECRAMIEREARLQTANQFLSARRLITVQDHEHERDVVLIALTLDGYDLGRRYSRFMERSGLWFQEWRNHWIWLIVGFLGGILATLLMDVIKSFVEPGS